jgi:hypothetical protein
VLGLATLVLALAAGCGSLESIGHTDLAWKTYKNSDHGYSISYPHDWEAGQRDPERVEEFGRDIVEIKGELTRKYDGAKRDEVLRIEAHSEESLCGEAASKETLEITIDDRAGVQTLCFREKGSCEPEPNCWALPYAIVRYFPATNDRASLTFSSDPTTDSFLMRRMLDTLHFTTPDLKARQ